MLCIPCSVRAPVGPVLGKRDAVSPDRLVSGAPRVGRADFEPRCEQNAVEFVFLAVRDDALLGETIDAAAVGIDEGHVRAIEGRQVIVMKARSLAELSIVGLERFRDHWIADGREESVRR